MRNLERYAALCFAFSLSALPARSEPVPTAKHPVEVRDSIESVRFGTPLEDFGGVQPPLTRRAGTDSRFSSVRASLTRT